MRAVLSALILAFAACSAHAGDLRTGGKLLLTGGVTDVEGVGGGGLANWATITGYETRDGVGANIHATEVRLSDFELRSAGAAAGLFDRVELSYAHQRFDTLDAGAALGLGRGYAFSQDIVGAKVRLAGEMVYDQDRWLPQVSAGAEYKRADRGDLVKALGARSADGVDLYVSATKLFLAQSLLLDATVRATRANQFGLLGFGGDRNGDYRAEFEGSAALLLTRRFAIGAEVRTKPDNLRFAHEDKAASAFAAYAFSKRLSLTVAYVDLGDIATFTNQRGVYASLQAGF